MSDDRKATRIAIGMTMAQRRTLETRAKKARPYQPVSVTLLEILLLAGTESAWEALRVPGSAAEALGGTGAFKGRARASDPDRERELREKIKIPPTPRALPDLDLAAEAAALIALGNELAGTHHRPDDPRVQQALFARLTGTGLDPADPGPATLDQVRETVEACARTWTPRFFKVQSILGPKFWEHRGTATAPEKQEDPDAGCSPEIRRRRARNRAMAADLERARLAGTCPSPPAAVAPRRRAPEPGDPDYVPI
jgi:hypothetical protein